MLSAVCACRRGNDLIDLYHVYTGLPDKARRTVGIRLLWSFEKVLFNANSLRSSPINRRMRFLCLCACATESVSFSFLHFGTMPVYVIVRRRKNRKKRKPYRKANDGCHRISNFVRIAFSSWRYYSSFVRTNWLCWWVSIVKRFDGKGTMHIAH